MTFSTCTSPSAVQSLPSSTSSSIKAAASQPHSIAIQSLFQVSSTNDNSNTTSNVAAAAAVHYPNHHQQLRSRRQHTSQDRSNIDPNISSNNLRSNSGISSSSGIANRRQTRQPSLRSPVAAASSQVVHRTRSSALFSVTVPHIHSAPPAAGSSSSLSADSGSCPLVPQSMNSVLLPSVQQIRKESAHSSTAGRAPSSSEITHFIPRQGSSSAAASSVILQPPSSQCPLSGYISSHSAPGQLSENIVAVPLSTHGQQRQQTQRRHHKTNRYLSRPQPTLQSPSAQPPSPPNKSIRTTATATVSGRGHPISSTASSPKSSSSSAVSASAGVGSRLPYPSSVSVTPPNPTYNPCAKVTHTHHSTQHSATSPRRRRFLKPCDQTFTRLGAANHSSNIHSGNDNNDAFSTLTYQHHQLQQQHSVTDIRQHHSSDANLFTLHYKDSSDSLEDSDVTTSSLFELPAAGAGCLNRQQSTLHQRFRKQSISGSGFRSVIAEADDEVEVDNEYYFGAQRDIGRRGSSCSSIGAAVNGTTSQLFDICTQGVGGSCSSSTSIQSLARSSTADRSSDLPAAEQHQSSRHLKKTAGCLGTACGTQPLDWSPTEEQAGPGPALFESLHTRSRAPEKIHRSHAVPGKHFHSEDLQRSLLQPHNVPDDNQHLQGHRAPMSVSSTKTNQPEVKVVISPLFHINDHNGYLSHAKDFGYQEGYDLAVPAESDIIVKRGSVLEAREPICEMTTSATTFSSRSISRSPSFAIESSLIDEYDDEDDSGDDIEIERQQRIARYNNHSSVSDDRNDSNDDEAFGEDNSFPTTYVVESSCQSNKKATAFGGTPSIPATSSPKSSGMIEDEEELFDGPREGDSTMNRAPKRCRKSSISLDSAPPSSTTPSFDSRQQRSNNVHLSLPNINNSGDDYSTQQERLNNDETQQLGLFVNCQQEDELPGLLPSSPEDHLDSLIESSDSSDVEADTVTVGAALESYLNNADNSIDNDSHHEFVNRGEDVLMGGDVPQRDWREDRRDQSSGAGGRIEEEDTMDRPFTMLRENAAQIHSHDTISDRIQSVGIYQGISSHRTDLARHNRAHPSGPPSAAPPTAFRQLNDSSARGAQPTDQRALLLPTNGSHQSGGGPAEGFPQFSQQLGGAGSIRGRADLSEVLQGISQLDKQKLERIDHSAKVSDGIFEYRHVMLPRNHGFLDSELDENLRDLLFTEREWRALGIRQTRGWEHYGFSTHEPSVFLFRRPVKTNPQTGCAPVESQMTVNARLRSLSALEHRLQEDPTLSSMAFPYSEGGVTTTLTSASGGSGPNVGAEVSLPIVRSIPVLGTTNLMLEANSSGGGGQSSPTAQQNAPFTRAATAGVVTGKLFSPPSSVPFELPAKANMLSSTAAGHRCGLKDKRADAELEIMRRDVMIEIDLMMAGIHMPLFVR